MKKVRVDKNTRPLPEFRAERGVSVRVDVQDYEKMQERLELLEEVYKAEEQLANGCVFRSIRTAIPASFGQAFRCRPDKLILTSHDFLFT